MSTPEEDLEACRAAYTLVCEAIVPNSPPGGAEAMATMVKLLRKERDDALAVKDKLIEYIDTSIDAICTRPPMYGSMGTVESMVLQLLEFRGVVQGHPHTNLETWRGWLAKHYPKVPSRARDLSYAIRWTYGEKDHAEMFKKELTRMVEALRGAR